MPFIFICLYILCFQISKAFGANNNDFSVDLSNIKYDFLPLRNKYYAYGYVKFKGANNCKSVQNYNLKCIFSDINIDSEEQFSYSHKVYPITCPNVEINVISENDVCQYFGCINDYNREIVSVKMSNKYKEYKPPEVKMIDDNLTAVIIISIIAIFSLTIIKTIFDKCSSIKDFISYVVSIVPKPKVTLPAQPSLQPIDVLSPNTSHKETKQQNEEEDEDVYLYGEQLPGPNQSVMNNDNEYLMSDSTVKCEFVNNNPNDECNEKSGEKILLPSCTATPV